MITLSEPLRDRQTIIDHVEARGRERLHVQGKSMSHADYLCGALAAMEAIGIPLGQAPASWTLGLMFSNRSPLDEPPTPEVAHA